MRKKLVLAMLVFAPVCFSFVNQKNEDPLPAQKKILVLFGKILSQKHYLKPVINDEFSLGIWNAYLKELDARKIIFLQQDIDRLKDYNNYLDNEILGDSIKFLPEVTRIYMRRYGEAAVIFRKILAKPFVFKDKDSVGTQPDLSTFAKDDNELTERWTRLLKYMTLERLVALKQDNKSKDKTDAMLEQSARESILKQQNRFLVRIAKYDQNRIFSNYLNAIARYSDPHSDYFPPLMRDMFNQTMANRFCGIGAVLKETDGDVSITSIEPGSPSAKSGLLATNDKIIKIGEGGKAEMTDIAGMELSDVVNLIRGEEGSTVRVVCRKIDGREITVSLIRQEMKQEDGSARSAIVVKGGKKIGYIFLPSFYDDFQNEKGAHCANDMAVEVTRLKEQHVSGIVVDLRNNGGGSLREAIKMVGIFVGQGPVVQVRTDAEHVQVLNNSEQKAIYDGPLTVLVNEHSASASEIFSAAIQDYKRGIVVGDATFGKGTVQQTLPLGLSEYGAFKITCQKFYRINGSSTQMKGVIPDVILPVAFESLAVREGKMPYALDWDMINPSQFVLKDIPALDQAITKARRRLAAEVRFKTIAQQNIWMEDYLDSRERTRKIAEVKKDMTTFAAMMKSDEALQQLPPDKKMSFNATGNAMSAAQNEKWIQSLSSDIYIDQAIKIILDLTS
ncbi:MAG: carboxyl-terminal protease [Mucilaginibacter sp.]|nr:carboxyl-terminal protease [Mucilaginibacter sp.]